MRCAQMLTEILDIRDVTDIFVIQWTILRQQIQLDSHDVYINMINRILSKKKKACQVDNFVVTYGTVSYLNDNFWCHQCWQSCQIDSH